MWSGDIKGWTRTISTDRTRSHLAPPRASWTPGVIGITAKTLTVTVQAAQLQYYWFTHADRHSAELMSRIIVVTRFTTHSSQTTTQLIIEHYLHTNQYIKLVKECLEQKI